MASICKTLRSCFSQRDSMNTLKIFANCMSRKEGSFDWIKDAQGEADTCPVCSKANCNTCCSPMYDSRKYVHGLPGNTRRLPFEHIDNVPTDVFRRTDGESLGPRGKAAKGGYYQVPEYFAYHHMTYYDLHLIMRANRQPSPKSKRKP